MSGELQYMSAEATVSSDRVCTNVSLCDDTVQVEAVKPTPTSDRECVDALELSQTGEKATSEASKAMSSGILGAVIVAALLFIVLVALLVGFARTRTDEKEPSLMDTLTMTPMTMGKQWASNDVNTSIYPMAGVLVPAVKNGNLTSVTKLAFTEALQRRTLLLVACSIGVLPISIWFSSPSSNVKVTRMWVMSFA